MAGKKKGLFGIDDPVDHQLIELGFDDEDSDEDITAITNKAAMAIAADQKHDSDNDSVSMLTILHIQKLQWKEQRRFRRTVRKITWVIGIALSVVYALEKLGVLDLSKLIHH